MSAAKPVADRGEIYEVHATDGHGRDVLVGYTNRLNGDDLVKVVQRHPVWHSPVVIDREAEASKDDPPPRKKRNATARG